MKTGTEIGIGIVIGVVITIGLVAGGWFGLIFLVERGYKKHDQKVEQAKVDGREFGKTTDQNGCMEKGFLRDAPGESFYSGVAFVEECLKSSKPIADFCDGVPLSSSVDWNNEQCQKVGHNTQSCFHAFVAKGNFCDGKKTEQARVDGREFGKTTDQNGCIEKGFLREATGVSGFVSECLESSKLIPDFCDGVPGFSDGKLEDSGWEDEQCKKVGHNNRSCSQIFNVKRHFCKTSNGDKSK